MVIFGCGQYRETIHSPAAFEPTTFVPAHSLDSCHTASAAKESRRVRGDYGAVRYHFDCVSLRSIGVQTPWALGNMPLRKVMDDDSERIHRQHIVDVIWALMKTSQENKPKDGGGDIDLICTTNRSD